MIRRGVTLRSSTGKRWSVEAVKDLQVALWNDDDKTFWIEDRSLLEKYLAEHGWIVVGSEPFVPGQRWRMKINDHSVELKVWYSTPGVVMFTMPDGELWPMALSTARSRAEHGELTLIEEETP